MSWILLGLALAAILSVTTRFADTPAGDVLSDPDPEEDDGDSEDDGEAGDADEHETEDAEPDETEDAEDFSKDQEAVADIEDVPAPAAPEVIPTPPAPQPAPMASAPAPATTPTDEVDPGEMVTHREMAEALARREQRMKVDIEAARRAGEQQSRINSVLERELDKYALLDSGKRPRLRKTAISLVDEELTGLSRQWGDDDLALAVKRAVKTLGRETGTFRASQSKKRGTTPVRSPETAASQEPAPGNEDGFDLLDDVSRARELKRITGVQI